VNLRVDQSFIGFVDFAGYLIAHVIERSDEAVLGRDCFDLGRGIDSDYGGLDGGVVDLLEGSDHKQR
jgi:hypothetical protein